MPHRAFEGRFITQLDIRFDAVLDELLDEHMPTYWVSDEVHDRLFDVAYNVAIAVFNHEIDAHIDIAYAKASASYNPHRCGRHTYACAKHKLQH